MNNGIVDEGHMTTWPLNLIKYLSECFHRGNLFQYLPQCRLSKQIPLDLFNVMHYPTLPECII